MMMCEVARAASANKGNSGRKRLLPWLAVDGEKSGQWSVVNGWCRTMNVDRWCCRVPADQAIGLGGSRESFNSQGGLR